MGYKIGVTEAGDAGIDLSWSDRVWNDEVDGAVIITKNVCAEDFLMNLCDNFSRKPNLVLHSTITGLPVHYEPNIPYAGKIIKALNEVVIDGDFPRKNIVIRVDPIIPTKDGIMWAESVFRLAADFGYKRFRVSVIDMYPHVRERFKAAGIELPYGAGFAPSAGHLARVDDLLRRMKKEFPGIRVESCAENLSEAIPQGCVSAMDLQLMGLDITHETIDSCGFQRKGCLCYSGKTELLKHKCQCPNKCVYCFWK